MLIGQKKDLTYAEQYPESSKLQILIYTNDKLTYNAFFRPSRTNTDHSEH